MKEDNNYLSFEVVEKMSQEERHAWVNEKDINTKDHIERSNLINFTYGLRLAGVKVKEPSNCGELTMDGYNTHMEYKPINPKDIGELIL